MRQEKANILITGGRGYIARSLKEYFDSSSNIFSLTRDNFDLTDTISVSNFFRNKFFDVVIHCATVGGSRLAEDGELTLYQNVAMFDNLILNKNSFKKLISFGSGAEIFHDTLYAKSKREINEKINKEENCFNLRIFATFNEHELSTRFIKSNIIRYLNKEPIIIHQDKYMDFFYMEDLCKLVSFYISSDNAPKVSECSYPKKYLLSEIADIINSMSNYKVPVIIEQGGMGDNYIGSSGSSIDFIGLEQGIYNTYNALKQNIG
jgi:dTDP-4-dehydrorhamnose reductase